MIKATGNEFYANRTWSKAIEYELSVPIKHPEWIEIFDQNGYRLTKLESHYAGANSHPVVRHGHEVCLRQDWFEDSKPLTGPHLNHAFLFERKGYTGEALEQLKEFAKENHLVHKLVNYKGKWGVDFSMDYVDSQGNSMEILHFEYDSYNFNEIQDVKGIVEETIVRADWDLVAQIFMEKKHEWIDLEFFEQSKWKTDFFNLPAERFKCNAWE
jgi:hypothetical protein